MSSSRENSPDWLRSFQAPTIFTTLSSDSEPSGDKSLARDYRDGERDESISDIKVKYDTNKSSNKSTTNKRVKVSGEVSAKRRKTEKQKKKGIEDDDDIKKEDSSEERMETHATNHLVLALSSDSESDSNDAIRKKEVKEESSMDESLKLVSKEEKNDDEESSAKVARKGKSPKKQMKTETVKPSEKKKTSNNMKIEVEVDDIDGLEEGIHEKHAEPRVSSSTLPLTLPDKVNRSKALFECEGESIDLSGDMGSVGRIIIPEAPSKEPEMFLDLKGTIYKTTIVPSRTFCVVSIGQSEAKIEAIMNDFIQLTPQSNVYDAETMVEGTLDGFSFDSEDEADKMIKDVKGDQNEGAEEKPNKKPRGKAEKKMGATQKKAKAAGGKVPKKKKPQTTKKGKSKK